MKQTLKKISSKVNNYFPKLFGKLLSLAFGLTWLVIVFKVLHLNYFDELPWYTVFLPFLFFILSALFYTIVLYAYIQWTLPPIAYTEEARRYLNRRFYQWRKPTKMKNLAAKLICLALSLFIAAMILC